MPVTKVCEVCGKEFKTPPRRSDAVKFCSLACKTEAGWVDLKCANCGKSYRRKKSEIRGAKRNFCSKECDYAQRLGAEIKKRRGPIYATCVSCGKQFEITKTRVETAKWCSKECKYSSPEWKKQCSETQQGEKSWRWAGGVYKRGTGYVLARKSSLGVRKHRYEHRMLVLNAMLESCPDHPFIVDKEGVKSLSVEIEVHHIDRNRSNNALSNLLAVTKDAHAQIHHRNRKPRPWECWPSDPEVW